MPLTRVRAEIHDLVRDDGIPLYLAAANQILVQVSGPHHLERLARRLRAGNYYLVTVVANDERELEDRCFKIYYIFSHATNDLFLMIEYLLGVGNEAYPSLYPWFGAVAPFEREIRDLFGLRPEGMREDEVPAGSLLHAAYPPELWPLRRDRSTVQLKRQVQAYNPGGLRCEPPFSGRQPPPGALFLPVGPVHAGIIEPGLFCFTIAGEVIEDVQIRLGYAHRGIERSFQARLTLQNGWKLAEQVAGDSAFAHTLAYCRAAEALAAVQVSRATELLRGLFLELERIVHHVGDVAGLVHDVALDRLAGELAVIREQLLRLNHALAGDRYLRGLNRPGGLKLPHTLDSEALRGSLDRKLDRFVRFAEQIASRTDFRDRAIGTGILTPEEAVAIGATGLAARASGIRRDYRRDHPGGIYAEPWLRPVLEQPAADGEQRREDCAGDVYARFLTRVEEVRTAGRIIAAILDRWEQLPAGERERLQSEPDPLHVARRYNYTFALGYAEGWRGDVVYWLMQDKLGGIYRCKVRDPSVLNWEALRRAIIPHDGDGRLVETILADFPLINKSFNLSYAGHDL